MELESKIFYSKTNPDKPQKIDYSLSGLGGSGVLSMTKGFNTAGQYCIHIRCEAGLSSLVKLVDFEGLSLWEDGNDRELKFVSFEEKDNNKKIYKKWEFTAGQLQFTENKNGLVQEREVSYSVASLSSEHRVFDPLSVVAFFHLEKLKPESENTLFIFGKQQLLKLNMETKSIGRDLKIHFKPTGMNTRWEKTLEKTEMILSEEGLIKAVSVPSPFFIGKIEMKIQGQREVTSKVLDEIVKGFQN